MDNWKEWRGMLRLIGTMFVVIGCALFGRFTYAEKQKDILMIEELIKA